MDVLSQLARSVTDLGTLLAGLRWLIVLGEPTLLVAAMRQLVEVPVTSFVHDYLLATRDYIGQGDFTQGAAIRQAEPYLRAVGDACLVLVVIWAAFHVMWSHSAHGLYSVRIVAPRLLLGFVVINFALPLVQAAVDANNALCDTVLKLGFRVDPGLLLSGTDPGGVPTVTLLSLAALIGALGVFAVAYIVRYALLVVLTITAPLAGFLLILPDTHHFAREWGSLFLTTLLMQPLQLLVIAVGFQLEAAGPAPTRHLFALASILIAFKVPGAFHATSSAGTHATSVVKHLATVAVKAATRI